jgi:hypothetical protein
MKGCKVTVKYPVFINCEGIDPDAQIGIIYSSFANRGEIFVSTSETPAIVPLATNTKAGLMSPTQFSMLSRADISVTMPSSGSTVTISGNNKCGTIMVSTGGLGQSGTILIYDISSYIQPNSVILFSDINDNYAMGHYQVVSMEIDNLGVMILRAKDGITLEPNTVYKWSYQINS